jgi:hypothetical protein
MAITATSLGTGVDTSSPFTMNTSGTVPSDGLVVCLVVYEKTGAGALGTTVSDGALTWAVDRETTSVLFATNNLGISVHSAPAPVGLATNTTITAAFTGGTPDIGVQLGMLYLTGADTGASRVDTTAANIRESPANANWTSGSSNTTNANDGIVGFGFSDNTATSSTAGGGAAEVFDVFNAGTGWDVTATFLEVLVTGSYSGSGTWSGTPDADASAMVAYKATPVAAADTQTRRYQIRRSRATSW